MNRFYLFMILLMGSIANARSTYKEGIIDAITELNDRTGSSMIAIKKHMQAKLPKEKKWLNATFLSALKSGVAAGDFVQIKNSYKLSPEFKKKQAAAAKPKKKAAPKKKKASSSSSSPGKSKSGKKYIIN